MRIPTQHRFSEVQHALARLPLPAEPTTVAEMIRTEADAINAVSNTLAPHILAAINDPRHWDDRPAAMHLVNTFIDLHLRKIEQNGLAEGDDRKLLALMVLKRALRTLPQRHTRDAIATIARDIGTMLLAKNSAYGNSALDPLRIFSKVSPIEQIDVRIDDKLSRMARGRGGNEDAEIDLIGYLVLRRVAMRYRAGMDLGS